jgi:hypothetical protein
VPTGATVDDVTPADDVARADDVALTDDDVEADRVDPPQPAASHRHNDAAMTAVRRISWIG